MAVPRRIGYWLVELDRLINERFDEDLAAGGLGRRQWQILHSLVAGPQPAADVEAALDAFWTDESEWDTELGALIGRGWVAGDAGTLSLTEIGRAAHEQSVARIQQRRRRMVEGISPQQYAETVDVLRRMAENMAAAGQPIESAPRSIG